MLLFLVWGRFDSLLESVHDWPLLCFLSSVNIFQTIRDNIEDGGKPQNVNLTRRAMKDPTGIKAYTKKGTYPGEWVLNIFKLWSFTLRYTLFLRAALFSTHTQCCLTFSWIVIQMLLRCCLTHITITGPYEALLWWEGGGGVKKKIKKKHWLKHPEAVPKKTKFGPK